MMSTSITLGSTPIKLHYIKLKFVWFFFFFFLFKMSSKLPGKKKFVFEENIAKRCRSLVINSQIFKEVLSWIVLIYFHLYHINLSFLSRSSNLKFIW